jgi:hypothetical protein
LDALDAVVGSRSDVTGVQVVIAGGMTKGVGDFEDEASSATFSGQEMVT